MSAEQSDLTTFDGEIPEGACVRFESCANVVPANGRICGDCLDAVRARDLLADLADASREDLLAFDGLGEKRTDRIIADISQRMDERGGD